MRLHVLAVAHSIPNGDYPTDPFTNKAATFARMMKEAGHEVIYYGVEGGAVDCDRYEAIVAQSTFLRQFPTPESTREGRFKSTEGIAWDEFRANAPDAIARNTKNPSEEFLLCFFGAEQRDIADGLGLIVVEPGIGYLGSFAPYRIFESYAWMWFTYGREDRLRPHFYDTVIPNCYYPRDYRFSAAKDDYFMFMGRVEWDKGVSVAVEMANYFGKTLVVAGHGDLDQAVPPHIPRDNIEHVGVLGMKEKVKYLSKAHAFFCPTLYVEPFGHVVPEASLCGTPVISTDFGAFSETVIEGVTGFRCRTFADFADAVRKLDRIDPATCRRSAIERFSVSKIRPRYEKYLSELLVLRSDPRGWYAVD